jgi:cytochrome-b5 reductase
VNQRSESGISPRRFVDCRLVDKRQETHNTYRFYFQVPGGAKAGLPVGQHVLLGAQMDDQLIVRPYTPTAPITADGDRGVIELLIKIYRADSHPSFQNGGLLTQARACSLCSSVHEMQISRP